VPRRRLIPAVLAACALTVLLAITACSSNSRPSWASALGSGVTVVAPAKAEPGNGSPDAAVEGALGALGSQRYSSLCAYVEPAVQAPCKIGMAQETPATAPTVKNAALGYAAIDGNEALVGTTGTICSRSPQPKCSSNSDPAALLSGGQPFAALWSQQIQPGRSNTLYQLAPCIEVNGHWYFYEPSLARL
jgi:hypothetical protein